jgi:hypothetical protein
VRKLLSLLVVLFVLITGCRQNANPLVVEAFHKKLYLSEINEKIPFLASKEDSLLFMEQYIEEWILRQTLLAQAKQGLTQKEQNFSDQIEQYRERLLINAYFQKISNNPALFEVSKQELDDFMNETKTEEMPEYRNMVKLHYIKLSEPSKHYKKIKELFFDDNDRTKSLAQIERICADTIEYYLDSDHWFYADFIEKELPFSFSELEKKDNQEKLDIAINGNRYLIRILDKKQQLLPKNVSEDRKIAQSLLQQQKKAAYITNYQDSLVKKALLERKVIQYPVQ